MQYLSREVHLQYCYHNRCGGDAIELEAIIRVGCSTSVIEQCTFDTVTIIGAEEMQLSWRLEELGAVRQ